MRERAEQYLGHEVKEAVITVPAYFNNNQREATKDAGEIAGLIVLSIVNEPTAAALAYGIDKDTTKKRNIFIFDLGGGTFDVSIVRIEGRKYDVLATYGDTHLGGEDFDQELVTYCIQRFKDQTDIDINTLGAKPKAKAIRRLRNECTKTKKILSAARQNDVICDALAEGEDCSVTITRAKFDQLCETHFNKIIPVVEKAINES